MPEVGLPFGKFHCDVALAVARTANGYDFPFYFFLRDSVFQLKDFAQHHTQFQLDGCTVQADRVRQSLDGEFLADFRLAAHPQRDSQHYPDGATALFTAEVNNRHGDSYLARSRRSTRGHSDSRELPAINRQTDNRACEQNVEVNR